MAMPQAPMPPPIIGGVGGLPPGIVPVNEWQDEPVNVRPYDDDAYYGRDEYHGSPVDDMFNNPDNKSKGKGKAKSSDKEPITTSYRAYLLEKTKPPPGEKADWSRVIKNDLPITEVELAEKIKRRYKQTKVTPDQSFNELSPLQRRMVSRLIAEHNRDEKHSNAVWTLADVWRVGEKRHGKMVDTRTMTVALKRSAKDALGVTEKATASTSDDFKFGEILDLSEPLSKKKDGAKGKDKEKVKKVKTHPQDWDDEYPRYEETDQRPPLRQDQRPRQPQPWDRPQPIPVTQPQPWEQAQQQPWEQPMPVYPEPIIDMPGQPPVPGAIPIPQHQKAPYDQPAQNPFLPEPHVSYQGQFDEPVWQPPHTRPGSQTPDRRRRRGSSDRRLKKLESKLDKLDHVVERLENLPLNSDQSSEGRDGNSVFWSNPPTGGSRTPPSTAPSEGDYRGIDLLLHRSKRERERDAARRELMNLRDEEAERERRIQAGVAAGLEAADRRIRDRALLEEERQRRREKQIRYRREKEYERSDRGIRDRRYEDDLRREEAVTIIPAYSHVRGARDAYSPPSSPLRTRRGDDIFPSLGQRARRTVLVDEYPAAQQARPRYVPEMLDDFGVRGGGRRREEVDEIRYGDDRRRGTYY